METGYRFLQAHLNETPQGTLNFEFTRYLGWPGQAPSYAVGKRIWQNVSGGTREGARLRPENFPAPAPWNSGPWVWTHYRKHFDERNFITRLRLDVSRGDLNSRWHTLSQLAADIDEAALVTDVPEPRVQAQALATAKAHAVSDTMLLRDTLPDGPTYIIAADSVFEFEGHAYGKPQHPDVAIERWRAQRGKAGILHSGHTIIAVLGGRKQRIVPRNGQCHHHIRPNVSDFSHR